MKIEDIFPDGKWASSGKEYIVKCPFCGDPPRSHNHCYVNVTEGMFYCHYCGEGGRIEKLLRKVGKSIKKVEKKKKEPQKVALVDFESFLKVTGTKTTLDRLASTYLRSRGVNDTDVEYYNIRYSTTGRFYGRVIIPVYENKKIVCFVARAFLPFVKPKYLFPRKGETILTANQVLFHYDEAVKNKGGSYLLVEGVLDAILASKKLSSRMGVIPIALLSSYLGESQEYKLARLGQSSTDTQFYVMLDSDANDKAWKLAKRLSKWGYQIKVCDLSKVGSGKQDPASVTVEGLIKSMNEAIQFSDETKIEVELGVEKENVQSRRNTSFS